MRSTPTERSRAFTLVELLATLVLVSLSVTLGAARLSVLSARAQLDDAASRLVDFDARARLLARAEGSLWLVWDDSKNALVAHRLEDGGEASRLELGDSYRVRFEVRSHRRSGTGSASERLLIDRDGRSVDAEWIVTDSKDVSLTRRVRVAGDAGVARVAPETAR